MKITKKILENFIKEELTKVLKEQDEFEWEDEFRPLPGIGGPSLRLVATKADIARILEFLDWIAGGGSPRANTDDELVSEIIPRFSGAIRKALSE